MERVSKKLSIGLSLAVLLSLVVGVSSVAGGDLVACCNVYVDFTADRTSGYAPLAVHFDDVSYCSPSFGFGRIDSVFRTLNTAPDDHWQQIWNFGDGATDSRQVCSGDDIDHFDVTHTYTQPGTYTVSLSYEYLGMCSSAVASILPISLWNSSRGQNGIVTMKKKELYITVLAPREEKKDRPVEPAKLMSANLNVNPNEVIPGQEVVISANVCNSGGESGVKTATLMVNGHAEQGETVGVGPGACKTVVFKVYKAVPGTYHVNVDGMQGAFTVVAPRIVQRNVPSQQDTGIGTVGIIAIVVVGIVLIIALVLIFKRE